jgi:hypothetical protein
MKNKIIVYSFFLVVNIVYGTNYTVNTTKIETIYSKENKKIDQFQINKKYLLKNKKVANGINSKIDKFSFKIVNGTSILKSSTNILQTFNKMKSKITPDIINFNFSKNSFFVNTKNNTPYNFKTFEELKEKGYDLFYKKSGIMCIYAIGLFSKIPIIFINKNIQVGDKVKILYRKTQDYTSSDDLLKNVICTKIIKNKAYLNNYKLYNTNTKGYVKNNIEIIYDLHKEEIISIKEKQVTMSTSFLMKYRYTSVYELELKKDK